VAQHLETLPLKPFNASLHPDPVGSASGPRVPFTGSGSPNP
jgi:hypothetical protein